MALPSRGYYLRFPAVFGSVLALFAIGFSYRREIFASDIERARQQNRENDERNEKAAEEIKRLSKDQFTKERERLRVAQKS